MGDSQGGGYHPRGLRKSPSYDGFVPPPNRGKELEGGVLSVGAKASVGHPSYPNEPPYNRRGRSNERPGRFDPPGYRRRSPDRDSFRRRSRSRERDRDWDRTVDRDRRDSSYKPAPRPISTYDMDAKQREEEAAKYVSPRKRGKKKKSGIVKGIV